MNEIYFNYCENQDWTFQIEKFDKQLLFSNCESNGMMPIFTALYNHAPLPFIRRLTKMYLVYVNKIDDIRYHDGTTLLHRAIFFRCRLEVIEYFMEIGCDTNNHDNIWKKSPMMFAFYYQNHLDNVLQLMLQTNIDINHKDSQRQTLLGLAIQSKRKNVIHRLLYRGATCYIRTNELLSQSKIECTVILLICKHASLYVLPTELKQMLIHMVFGTIRTL